MPTSRDEQPAAANGDPAEGPRARLAVFVAGGPLALAALSGLAARHDIVLLVRAGRQPGVRSAWRGPALRLARALGVRPADPISEWARGAGVPILESRPGAEELTAQQMAAFRPDFGCIATYPRRIPSPLLAAAGRECLNLHTSLLPRHRGANPLFWTYQAGDSEAGVTVHRVTARLDAGPIVARAALPLARGEPIRQLHARCAEVGGPMLATAVTRLVSGSAAAVEQDEAAATSAPSPVPGRRYCELDRWSVEQAWHFLAGLVGYYTEPLTDSGGGPVRYRGVEGFEVREPPVAPGTVRREGAGWSAWARDGVVRLSASLPPGRRR